MMFIVLEVKRPPRAAGGNINWCKPSSRTKEAPLAPTYGSRRWPRPESRRQVEANTVHLWAGHASSSHPAIPVPVPHAPGQPGPEPQTPLPPPPPPGALALIHASPKATKQGLRIAPENIRLCPGLTAQRSTTPEIHIRNQLPQTSSCPPNLKTSLTPPCVSDDKFCIFPWYICLARHQVLRWLQIPAVYLLDHLLVVSEAAGPLLWS